MQWLIPHFCQSNQSHAAMKITHSPLGSRPRRIQPLNHQRNVGRSWEDLGVSINQGTPKSSFLIQFSILNHSKPTFWVPPFSETTHLGPHEFSSELELPWWNSHQVPPSGLAGRALGIALWADVRLVSIDHKDIQGHIGLHKRTGVRWLSNCWTWRGCRLWDRIWPELFPHLPGEGC